MARVLDSSAVLAVVKGEPGADVVLPVLPECVLSSVNVTEVLRVLTRGGIPVEDAQRVLARLHVPVIPFDTEQAHLAAEIGAAAPALSLGDCACLALARARNASDVLTTDQAWARFDAGVKVTLIR